MPSHSHRRQLRRTAAATVSALFEFSHSRRLQLQQARCTRRPRSDTIFRRYPIKRHRRDDAIVIRVEAPSIPYATTALISQQPVGFITVTVHTTDQLDADGTSPLKYVLLAMRRTRREQDSFDGRRESTKASE